MERISQAVSQELLKQQMEELFKSIEDPISYNEMNDSLALVPCGHSLNRDSCINIRGTAQAAHRTAQCPLDRTPIHRFVPNHMFNLFVSMMKDIREIEDVKHQFKKILAFVFKNPVICVPCGDTISQESYDHAVFAAQKAGGSARCQYDHIITSVIPNHTLKSAFEPIEKIARQVKNVLLNVRPNNQFPGESAHFSCIKSWDYFNINYYPGTKRMMLISDTSNSFLSIAHIIGDPQGNIRIELCCNEYECEIFQNYVLNAGFSPQYGNVFCARTYDELKWALKILEEHNELPEDNLIFLKRLVEINNWKLLEEEDSVNPMASTAFSILGKFSKTISP